MIISFDIACESLVQRAFSGCPRSRYGLAFAYLPEVEYCGYLAQGEDLYLTGHGSPEAIGHPCGEPSFAAPDLSAWLRDSVLPFDYYGDLYIAAPGCTTGFLCAVRECLGGNYEGGVFGHFDPGIPAPLPAVRSDWVRVA